MKKIGFVLLLTVACLVLPRLAQADPPGSRATAAPLTQAQIADVLGLSASDLSVLAPAPKACGAVTFCAACTTNADCVQLCGGCTKSYCHYCTRCGCFPNACTCG